MGGGEVSSGSAEPTARIENDCTAPRAVYHPRVPSHAAVADRTKRAAVALAVIAAAGLAYGPVLALFFQPIDDPLLLWSVRQGLDPTPHFRPLYAVWNGALEGLFGARPLGFYACGLAVHALCALGVATLAGWIARGARAALVAGIAFACFYSPNEAVCWIAANCGLLCVLCVIAGGVAWSAFLDERGRRPVRARAAYVVALVALALAMGFKEDCVLAGALFLGLDLARDGLRGWSVKRVAPYALPALLALFYLRAALRPELWSERASVGQYAASWELVPKALQNLALLFWPRATYVEGVAPRLVFAGAGLALFALFWLRRGEGARLARLGIALALFGLLPALPGRFPIAGTRYAYPAAVGAALFVAGAFEGTWTSLAKRPARLALAAGLVGWIALECLALRSVLDWRYAARSERLRRMVESSRALLDARPALVVGPQVLNAHDYFLALCLWLEVPRGSVSGDALAFDDALAERFAAGAELDPRRSALFACRRDGELFRLRSAAELPWDAWRELADEREHFGEGRTLPTVRLALPESR